MLPESQQFAGLSRTAEDWLLGRLTTLASVQSRRLGRPSMLMQQLHESGVLAADPPPRTLPLPLHLQRGMSRGLIERMARMHDVALAVPAPVVEQPANDLVDHLERIGYGAHRPAITRAAEAASRAPDAPLGARVVAAAPARPTGPAVTPRHDPSAVAEAGTVWARLSSLRSGELPGGRTGGVIANRLGTERARRAGFGPADRGRGVA